jgi:hypothetical protein
VSELEELKNISRILTLANSEKLEVELSKYATTDDRKRIWVLINGKSTTKDIVSTLGLTRRAVEMFLKSLEIAEFIDSPWGKPPKKRLNFVPASWIELIKPQETNVEQEANQKEIKQDK